MAVFIGPKIVKKASGVAEYATVSCATGQTFVKGELVYLASGQATAVASDGVVVYGIAQETADAAATTTMTQTVEIIHPEDDVEMTCSTTPTYANIGINYALVIVAGTSCKADLSDTGNDAIVCVGLVYDTGGNASTTRAIFHFLPAVCQSNTGA